MEDREEIEEDMGYLQTLMYGQYSRSLAAATKEEAKMLKKKEKRQKKEMKRPFCDLRGNQTHGRCYQSCSKVIKWVWRHTFAKIGEDWVFLAILGITMAIVSFGIDFGIEKCISSRRILYEQLSNHAGVKYLIWISLPILLILFAAGFVDMFDPQAVGSGIPEIKTILRGVNLKEYLTWRTLIAKTVGLIATLGSGMPLGKEGPFVHIACIVATLMSSLVTQFQSIYANESRKSEMLAAAAAVGVACCFAAPVGGVLFSIEVTAAYFAVRNYWRGFFAAVCGAVMFRLIAVLTNSADTVEAMFRTAFKVEYPYDPLELFVFAGIGVVCGVGGWLYVYLHRHYVLWMRGNKRLTKFLQKYRFIYPTLVALFLASITFPPWMGQFHASILGTREQIVELFSNTTWGDTNPDLPSKHHLIMMNWTTPYTSIFTNLSIYIAYTFFGSILASTLPVPTGVVIPSFKTGAAFGRLVGEAVALWFPLGIIHGEFKHFIVPGGYAIAGAAAFTGAVTHTLSISVIIFEMTGQITHIIPVLIAVLVSNAIAQLLGPSCFDSIILIKKLPYLPDILPSSSSAYTIYVDDFMKHNVKYIWQKITYYQLNEQLMLSKRLRSFPLVDSPDQMVLLGSIQRSELIQAIERQISNQKRFAEALHRRKAVLEQRRALVTPENEEEELVKEVELMEEEEEMAGKFKKEKELLFEKNKISPTLSDSKRRPSRFEVTIVKRFETLEADKPPSFDKDATRQDKSKLSMTGEESGRGVSKAMLSLVPKKSILKKNHLHTIGLSCSGSRDLVKDSGLAHHTLAGFEHQPCWKNKLQTMFSHPTLRDEIGSGSNVNDVAQWEDKQMKNEVDFSSCKIDPAPFQLVKKTSLVKVHSLFSLVGVKMAYVTSIGRLVGVVGLKELRAGIESANSKKPAVFSPTQTEKGSVVNRDPEKAVSQL